MFCLWIFRKAEKKYQIEEKILRKTRLNNREKHENVSFKMYFFEAISRVGGEKAKLSSQFDVEQMC
jgi:hypothetical protein